jgi:hypothetical protein
MAGRFEGRSMLMLTDALIAERAKRQRTNKEESLKRQMGREVLRRLGERLVGAKLHRWYFIPNGDELVVIFNKDGAGSRQRIGAWSIDEENRLCFGAEKTEWITTESWARVIDKAVTITAQVILDHDAQAETEATAGQPGDASVVVPSAIRAQLGPTCPSSPATTAMTSTPTKNQVRALSP